MDKHQFYIEMEKIAETNKKYEKKRQKKIKRVYRIFKMLFKYFV